MRDHFRLGAAGGFLGVACATSPALATGAELGRGIELQWIAPPGCPDGAWAERAIRNYLGERKLESAKPIAVRVQITSLAGGRYRATIALEGGAKGDRRFEGVSCARVGDAAVLIVALMFDPVEVIAQMEAPSAETQGANVLSPGQADRRAEGGLAARSLELAFQAAGDVGSLPGPTVGAGLAAGIRFGRMFLGADAVAWFPRRAFGGPTAASGGEIGLLSVSVRGCFAAFHAFAALRVEPCLRAEGGLSNGRGFGIAEPSTTDAPWGAAFVGLSVRQSTAEALSAWLSIEGGVPFVRPSYVIEDFGPVFRASPVVGRAAFGLAWALP